jgi:glucose/arabinose dehydrogenase
MTSGLVLLCICSTVLVFGQVTSSPPVVIHGSERIGWSQRAADTAQLQSLQYVVYLDGVRSQLNQASCETTPGPEGYACTAPLPAMSSGTHTIELGTQFKGYGSESPRSTRLLVRVLVTVSTPASSPGARVTTASDKFAAGGGLGTMVATTKDGVRLRMDLVVDGLVQPTDLAFSPDNRILVAERSGRVRVIRDGLLRTEPALVLDDLTTNGQSGLLALALDPAFNSTHYVYVLYTTLGSAGSAFRLARFREANDTLADRVVILENIAASPVRPAASLRFGPDGKLYAAFDDADEFQREGDMASYNGKILRLNLDGTTPDGQVGYTPVYAANYRSPRGLDWQPGTGWLWAAESDASGSTRLDAIGPGRDRLAHGTLKGSYAVPSSGASALSFYTGALIPAFRGNLLVAEAGCDLLRIRFNQTDPPDVTDTERLFQGGLTTIGSLSAPSDGAIYIGTENAVMKIVPVR